MTKAHGRYVVVQAIALPTMFEDQCSSDYNISRTLQLTVCAGHSQFDMLNVLN
jgi:hypothetical protein